MAMARDRTRTRDRAMARTTDRPRLRARAMVRSRARAWECVYVKRLDRFCRRTKFNVTGQHHGYLIIIPIVFLVFTIGSKKLFMLQNVQCACMRSSRSTGSICAA